MRSHWTAITARHGTILGIAAALIVGALGLLALRHLLAEVRIRDIRAAYHLLPGWRIATALGLTVFSYLALTLYDVLALRIIGRTLPWRTAALASFTSYTLSHNLGLSLLTGGSARYRIYTAAGLDGADVARVVGIAGVAFWAGVFALAALALAGQPGGVHLRHWPISIPVQRGLGVTLLIGMAALVIAGRGGRVLRIAGWSLPLPDSGQALAQIGVAALDLAAASAALFVLVPHVGANAYPAFFLGYALAIIVALISHVPGGIGIFETVMLAALPGVDRPTLFAALILYRLIYYILPLLVGALLLAAHEGWRFRHPVGRAFDRAQSIATGVAPLALAALAFTGGLVLLISGSLPAVPGRLRALHGFVPLPFIEASHIAASLAGTGLLLLAPGLYRRLDGAFVATRALLLAGAAFSLAKGLDYEEAIVLLAISAALQWTRAAFYRRTRLTAQPLTAGWIAAILTAVALSLWIGFFAYKHVDYQDSLWWQFALSNNASRFLRASFGIAILLAAGALWRLFGGVSVPPASAVVPLDAVLPALATATRTEAMLAFTGDKHFLLSDSGDAFLMYRVQGHSWIVMGDPVGPETAWADLLWQMRELADRAQGRLLLYQISRTALPLAIDLGLQIVKYGEEARVDLSTFTLEGPAMRGLRQPVRRAEREGARFAIVPAGDVPAILPDLRALSDAWLAAKGQREKAFSLGRFDDAYVRRFDCAVVYQHDRIVAFANIWATADRSELSVDLMRHADIMPYGTMDFLFAELMLWGRALGYRWFTLGLAPLSGLTTQRLAPIWSRAGAFLYRHGENFYGFEGLRGYKNKFGPVWEPRYVASGGGISLPRALIDLERLVGGRRDRRE
ncbi:MAG TPA: bifunctional lysylphosphatidylglycerol flippase/synthetase MprF [Sphingomonas sp.]|jgi:phosphatidylglycerol lysyltransferase|uniref:bifunctional lysylphosphatidylglycerol flippase/synthetase MprF n=1 Tax=Sphingomonas sp. TaxID=28214 RepID=UPI002ED7CAC7